MLAVCHCMKSKEINRWKYTFQTVTLIYLRRIFEKILIDVFNENIEKIEMDFDTFKKERMEDKIKILTCGIYVELDVKDPGEQPASKLFIAIAELLKENIL